MTASVNLDRIARDVAAKAGLPKLKSSIRQTLVTCNEGYYIKGLLFDRTGRKNSLYVYAAVFPKFEPSGRLVLCFSERINDGFTIDGSQEEIVEQVVTCVETEAGLRSNLVTPLEPAEFLSRQTVDINYPERKPLSRLFVIAVSAALVGDTGTAIKLAELIWSRSIERKEPEHGANAQALLDCVHGKSDLSALIDRIARETGRA